MFDKPEVAEDPQLIQLKDYWANRIEEFESQVYPVFHERGYSKNTALLAYVLDELESSMILASQNKLGAKG